MLAAIAINWLVGLAIVKFETQKKKWLSFGIIIDILLLAIFKYTAFVSENIATLIGNENVIVKIALPIGISFFTFQMMSYIFDVYYGKADVQRNPFYLALYVSLFPQLIAGPIVRYSEISVDILDRNERLPEIIEGFERFIYGLGKKVLLANYLAKIADNVFDSLSNPSALLAWLGLFAYAMQIYYDFSGYSDMAIGLGKMFGFHFSENFNYPYISKSVTEFWRRWHISLSSWFRDYVYIPLGGNRVSKSRHIFNLFIVWLLTGIWHGANWTFLLWGLIYFVFIVLEKYTHIDKKIGPLSYVYTMLVVLLAWVFFRSSSISNGITYISHLFALGETKIYNFAFLYYIKSTWFILLLSIIGVFPITKKLFSWLESKKAGFIERVWLMLVFGLSITQLISNSYNPFIYFNF